MIPPYFVIVIGGKNICVPILIAAFGERRQRSKLSSAT